MRVDQFLANSRWCRVAAALLPNLLGLVAALGFLAGWEPGAPWKNTFIPALACGWAVVTLLADPSARRAWETEFPARRRLPLLVSTVGLAVAIFLTPAVLSPWPVGVTIAGALVGAGLRPLFRWAVRRSGSPGGEALRWAAVAGAALFAIQPYATRGLVGGGDAQHYAQQLADAITQTQAGVFPLFVGQSIYSYNGDIHPLRTAPYFQYAGVALNFLTGSQLGAPGVQNLLLVLTFLAAGALAYLLGLSLAGASQAWWACGLAVAFLTCPGVLALVYSGDMVASWLTLPFLVLLGYALLRASEDEDPAPALLLVAAAFGATWLAHAPIAFWISPLIACCLAGVAWRLRPGARGLWLAAGTGIAALALAAYVFVSVAALEVPDDPNLIRFVREGGILAVLRAGWNGWLRPVEPSASDLLRNLQLSPILWLALLAGLPGLWKRRRTLLPFWIYLGLLLALLLPIAGIAGHLWAVMPAAVIGPTEKWPMQRFYPIISALAPFLALAGLPRAWSQARLPRLVLSGVLLAGCGYSLLEAKKFINRGRGIASPPTFTAERFREENAILSRYSYEMYGRLPRYFSQGPMAPFLENRLLASGTLEISQSNLRSLLAQPRASAATFAFQATDYGARFEPKLTLQPGQVYLVAFDLGPAPPEGVLELVGRTIYRQYPLSAGVEKRAFQDEAGQEHGFALWTSDAKADEVELRFYGTPGTAGPKTGQLRLITVQPETLPLRLQSLIPYRLSVSVQQGGWLETPKIFLPGYAATVDQQPVKSFRSPDGLLMIPVKSGAHEIGLRYEGPWMLRAAFWFTPFAWLAVIAVGAFAWPGSRRPQLPSTVLVQLGRFGAAALVLVLMVGGAIRIFARAPAASVVAAGGAPISLQLALPVGRDRASESILTVRRDQHEIGLFAHYADGQHVILGFTRDGSAWAVSSPVAINYVLPHDLAINWGAGAEPGRIVIDQQIAVDGQSPAPAGNGPAIAGPLPPFSGRILSARPLAQERERAP